MRTFDQFASNSSAMSIGNAVLTPCPISERVNQITTSPLGSMAKYTLGVNANPRLTDLRKRSPWILRTPNHNPALPAIAVAPPNPSNTVRRVTLKTVKVGNFSYLATY